MKITYERLHNEKESEAIREIAFECGVLYDTARLMYYRGIKDGLSAKKFLSPGKNNFHDPYLFNDMREVVKRLLSARADSEKVLIFGDYDVDGISAVTVLYNCLSEFGIKADAIVPEREEGYGINLEKILSMPVKPDLIVTVDCGISEAEKVKELKKTGVDVIVTDHHEPSEILPDCLFLNPKADDAYPFDGLCGAGVAYKLGYALIGERANDYLDFVALATVSDSMELVGENRDIVTEGLKLFNGSLRPCFSALLGDNVKTVTSQTLAFSIAPKINAGGRMGDANSSLKLFMTKSMAEIAEISDLLKAYNVQRQIECENVYKEAVAKILSEPRDYVIAVKDEKWNTGFTGIVASRLAEKFSCPVIVFGGMDGMLKGSARSVNDVNVFNVLSSAKDLFVSFGGHAQAAGVTIEEGFFEEFKKRINDYYKKEYGDAMPEKTFSADWEVDAPFSMRFIKELELLEPFGVGNKRPCFGVNVSEIKSLPLKAGSPHYSFDTDVISMLDFNGEADAELLSLPLKKTVIFETNYSVFRGKESVKGFVREIVADYSDLSSVSGYIIKNELEKMIYPKGETPLPFGGELIRGAVYALSDESNLAHYLHLGFPVTLYYPTAGSIVVSPKTLDGFETVVYLDKPASFIRTSAKTYCNFSLKGYNFIHKIKTDRESMAVFYRKIVSYVGKDVSDPVRFYADNQVGIGLENFLFAMIVFTELKILSVSGGKLSVSGIRRSLNESSVYNGVVKLQEDL